MLRTAMKQLWTRLTDSRKSARRPRNFLPTLDPLEDRCTPVTLTVGPTSTYHTIMAAVSVANSGDIINVNPGIYQEQVVIPAKGANNLPITSLQLNSLGATPSPTQMSPMAIIQAPASLTSGDQPIVDINGATGVTISKFEITGQTSGAFENAGVYVEGNGSATITGNWITHIQTNNQSGIGVLVGNTKSRVTNGTKGTATVTSNIVDNYGKAGIADVNGSSATISYNTVTGSGTSSPVLQYGIEMGSFQNGDGAGGSVTNNSVTGNLSFDTTGSFQAAGILIYNAGTVTKISNNNLGTNAGALPNGTTIPFSNDVGIWVFSQTGTAISNNDIYETKYDGMVFDEVNTMNSGLSVSNNDIEHSLGDGMLIFNTKSSTFANNDTENNGQSGIWLALNVTGCTFTQDISTGNGTFGVLVADYDPNSPSLEAYVKTPASSTGNTFSQNTITGNNTSNGTGIYDAEDFSVGSLTGGTGNKWKNNTIGTKNPSGLQ